MTKRRAFDFQAVYRAALRKFQRERPIQPSAWQRETQRFIDSIGSLLPPTSEPAPEGEAQEESCKLKSNR